MRFRHHSRRATAGTCLTVLLVLTTLLSVSSLHTAPIASAQDAEPVTLKILGLAEANADFVQYAVAEFEKLYPNVTVEITVQPEITAAEASIKASFASGDVPDLAYMYEGGSRAPLFAREGLLLPLNDFIANDPAFDVNDIAKGLMGTASIGDQIYGVPFFQVSLVYIWNKAVLTEVGMTEPPKTDADVVTMCQALAAKGLTFDPAVGLVAGAATPSSGRRTPASSKSRTARRRQPSTTPISSTGSNGCGIWSTPMVVGQPRRPISARIRLIHAQPISKPTRLSRFGGCQGRATTIWSGPVTGSPHRVGR